ncbi:hypothetical protein, partial [Bacillus sp. 522_BSPC]|uniref:hypothetical protein n=1 Tax=Bacillus sp. 522_BSPC TaxID=1579338 RepID=UPI0006615AB9
SRNVGISTFKAVLWLEKNFFQSLTCYEFLKIQELVRRYLRFARANWKSLTLSCLCDAHWISAKLMKTNPPMSLGI